MAKLPTPSKKTIGLTATVVVGVVIAGVLMNRLGNVPGIKDARKGYDGQAKASPFSFLGIG